MIKTVLFSAFLLMGCSAGKLITAPAQTSEYCSQVLIPLLPQPEHGPVHPEIEDHLYDHFEMWLDQECDTV